MKLLRSTMVMLLLAVVLVGSGCRKNVTTPGQPPPSAAVTTAATLLDASNTCLTVEDSLTAASHTIDKLKDSDPEYYAKIDPLIKKISAANTAAALKVQAAMKSGATDWKSAMVAIASSVNVSDLNAAGIKNPTSQTIAAASLASLIAILNTINQNFGGKP
jgi:hypothetical protein